MTKRILLLSLLAVLWAVASVAAQEPLSIRKFGGMHDNKALFTMEPGEAVISINWDYSQLFGGIHKRDGITVKYGATAQPIGLYGYLRSNGDKRLLMVRNLNSSRFSSLVYSALRTSAPSTLVNMRYLYKDGNPYFAQYNDIVVISDGKTPALRYNGNNFDYLVWPPPGSPQFMVLNGYTSNHVLHGDYYYSWRTILPCSTTVDSVWGPLSGPSYQVHVDSGQVLIMNLSRIAATAVCGSADSNRIQILRTMANKQPTDTMYAITTIVYGMTAQNILSAGFRDTIPDDSLGNADYPSVGVIDTITRTANIASDSAYRIGMMMLTSIDTGGGPFNGVSNGISRADTSWVANRYFTMWYDSVTMMCSDASPSVRVAVGWGVNDTTYDSSYTFSIPSRPYANADLWTLVCKQQEIQLSRKTYDTFAIADYPAEYRHGVYMCYVERPRTGGYWTTANRFWDVESQSYMCHGVLVSDTTTKTTRFELPHIVDTIKGTDSVWSDTLSWGSTNGLPEARPGWTLPPMKYPTVYNDRVYMAEGSKVYYSDVTTDGPEIARWSPANAFAVNPDDGDEITGLWVCDGKLFIGKNRSIYTAVYANGVHLVEVFVRGVGCVAPRSIIDLPGGGFAFLSEHGVYSFSPALQSPYKESGGNLPGISDAIQNHLDKYTVSQLSTCVSWLANDDRNLVFSFPAVDTSWVYSIPTGQWGAWVGFSPSVTTRYDTLYQVDQRPFDGILFTQDGSDSIYLFGSGKRDTGKVITATWKSGPLFQSYDYGSLWQYGIWRSKQPSPYSLGDSPVITTTIYDEAATSKSYSDSTNIVYQKHSCYPVESRWFQFQIQTSADSCAIQGIDWRWQPGSEGGVK